MNSCFAVVLAVSVLTAACGTTPAQPTGAIPSHSVTSFEVAPPSGSTVTSTDRITLIASVTCEYELEEKGFSFIRDDGVVVTVRAGLCLRAGAQPAVFSGDLERGPSDLMKLLGHTVTVRVAFSSGIQELLAGRYTATPDPAIAVWKIVR